VSEPRGTEGVDAVPEYVVAHVHEALATDPRVMEQGIEVVATGSTVVLMGRVFSQRQHDAASEVAHEQAPGFTIRNDLEVLDRPSPPGPVEQLR